MVFLLPKVSEHVSHRLEIVGCVEILEYIRFKLDVVDKCLVELCQTQHYVLNKMKVVGPSHEPAQLF